MCYSIWYWSVRVVLLTNRRMVLTLQFSCSNHDAGGTYLPETNENGLAHSTTKARPNKQLR
jgi:hypothetical protein